MNESKENAVTLENKRGLPQEGLKLIACFTMLLDHIGAVFVPGFYLYYALRFIGRIAFPIYCFLLAEGAHYTHNPRRYALRLAIGVVLSEVPFDLAFSGGWDWGYQSVMVTLLLGFCALTVMQKCSNYALKLLAAVPFAVLAELLQTDYGGWGVALIAMFGITRGLPHERWIQLLCMTVICWLMPSAAIRIGGFRIPVEIFALLSMIPIALYSGRKVTRNKAAQWGFYLFYPVHLTVLYLIRILG